MKNVNHFKWTHTEKLHWQLKTNKIKKNIYCTNKIIKELELSTSENLM